MSSEYIRTSEMLIGMYENYLLQKPDDEMADIWKKRIEHLRKEVVCEREKHRVRNANMVKGNWVLQTYK